MIPHFMLQGGKQEYLIFKTEDAFHLIDCNEALTREKRSIVLESGCTPMQMQQMGLSGTTIPRSDIEAITITGCGFQDDVIFYLSKKKKLSFCFPKAYEQRKVDDFFRGIPRKQVKSRRRLKGGRDLDWRLKEQDEELYRKLRPVGWVYNILAVLICIYPLILGELHRSFHGWIVMGMYLIGLGLDIFLPEYFSILVFEDPARKAMKRRYGTGRKTRKTRAIYLGYGILLMVLTISIGLRNIHVIDQGRMLKYALCAAIAIFVALVILCREFQEEIKANFWWVLVYLSMTLAINYVAVLPHFNHVLGGELTSFTAPIIDQHYSGGKSTTYYCTVNLPDGRELDLQVSHEEYEALEPGDIMKLKYGTGFFGIEYAIDE